MIDGRFGDEYLCVADGGQGLLLVRRLGYTSRQYWVLLAMRVYALVSSMLLTVLVLSVRMIAPMTDERQL